MINIIRTNSQDPNFIKLNQLLDAELAERDGDANIFYAQFNKINVIKYVVLAYEDEKAVACGAIKEYEPDTMEIKRMYVVPESRGKGIASQILAALENWTSELSCQKCILETGKRQFEAASLYRKCGYDQIPNYGEYADDKNSLCFEKQVKGSI